MLGNARTVLNGGGGSGEPTTLEVVHGLRAACFGSWAGNTHTATATATTPYSGGLARRPVRARKARRASPPLCAGQFDDMVAFPLEMRDNLAQHSPKCGFGRVPISEVPAVRRLSLVAFLALAVPMSAADT